MLNNRRYVQYKPANLNWLDVIPYNWVIHRAKYVFKEIDCRSDTGEEELLTVSSNFGVVKRKNINVTMFKAASYIGYKLCWKDDLVINSLWAWMNGLGFSKQHGIVSTAYGVYRLYDSKGNVPKYLNYLLRSRAYDWEFMVRSKGIWKSRLQLTDDSFLNIPIIIPMYFEQIQIARYLDYKNSQINKYIHIKKRQIGLLKELLDTKIEQLVDILNSDTSHQFRLKSILRSKIKDGPHETPEFMSTGIPFLSVDGIQNDELKFEGCRFISEIAHNRFKQKVVVERDDILLGKAASTGKVARVKVDFEFSVWSPLAVIKVKKSIALPEFVEFMLQSCYCQNQIYTLCTSNTQRNISMDDIPKVKLPIPNMETQFSIIEEISKLKKDVNAQVNILENQINLMHEFKTRLISDVVTGKLDVRHLEVYNLLETDTQDGFEDMTGGELEETDANN